MQATFRKLSAPSLLLRLCNKKLFKPWESPYACLSNNPIIRIDPNGDDDYFDSKGKYLGSDKNGTKVRVLNNPVNKITNLYTKAGVNTEKKFYGLDVSAGAKLIFGVKVQFKIGFQKK
jgi:hypothetical protein